jgi:DNA-binding NtrC family response regulator
MFVTENDALSPVLRDHFFVHSVNPAMRAIERVMAEIAPTDIPVLLVGESGTGKEAAARQIHRLSHRREEAFHKLVCATLAPDSIPELARTQGAENSSSNSGWSGTVFLDEIGELASSSQSVLLHALPDDDTSVGDPVPGVRFISTTGRNLEEEIRTGQFRKELYYRLNGACLRLPPLRDRREDVPLLVEFFLAKHSTLLGRTQPSLNAQTLRVLQDYAWPGNIRELENVVKKVIVLGDEDVALADLAAMPDGGAAPEKGTERFSLKQAARAASRQAERELILKVLERTRWNRKRAAHQLQISYKALLYKLKQMGLDSTETA